MLRPPCELVAGTVDSVLDRWLAVVDLARPAEVTVDLTAVDVVDEHGLHMLRFLGDCLARRGVDCRLGAPAPGHRSVDA